MIGALIVSHGGLAREFLRAAHMIQPDLENIEALVLDWDEDPDQAGRQVEAAIQRLHQGQGVVILTDMFGGTPSNLSLPFLESGRVEIVSGVNLAMVVKLSLRDRPEVSISELAGLLRDKGRKSIEVASELLDSEQHKEAV